MGSFVAMIIYMCLIKRFIAYECAKYSNGCVIFEYYPQVDSGTCDYSGPSNGVEQEETSRCYDKSMWSCTSTSFSFHKFSDQKVEDPDDNRDDTCYNEIATTTWYTDQYYDEGFTGGCYEILHC
eukprot:404651_1